MLEFKEFDKISRLNREVFVTEKIDGTNGQVHIRPADDSFEHGYDSRIEVFGLPHYIRAGSRNRWVTNVGGDDNNGFGRWVLANAAELAALGTGAHYGEWWGQGIQRKYGLTEKRFSLFNVGRWKDPNDVFAPAEAVLVPSCCYVVPILARGIGLSTVIDGALQSLRERGSYAAPSFMNPEGIVAFHSHSRTLFKVTLERDQEHKFQRTT